LIRVDFRSTSEKTTPNATSRRDVAAAGKEECDVGDVAAIGEGRSGLKA
jgi:hypothetical protein